MLKTSKFILFFSGLAVGGAAVVYIYSQMKSSDEKIIVTVPAKSDYKISTRPKNDTSLKKLQEILERNSGETKMVLRGGNVEVEEYQNIDHNSALYDSLIHEESIEITGNEEISFTQAGEKVKREKMIARGKLKIHRYGKATSQNDSLLAEMNGIKPLPAKFMEVEYWVSPLNFKGYKLGRSRLILYGVEEKNIRLATYENNFYLIEKAEVYLLIRSQDFNTFKPLPDKKVAAILLGNAN